MQLSAVHTNSYWFIKVMHSLALTKNTETFSALANSPHHKLFAITEDVFVVLDVNKQNMNL